MAPVLQEGKEKLQRHVEQSKEIVQQLKSSLRKAQPDHLVATLTVANRGGRPLALRNIGVLYLQLPPMSSGDNETVTVDLVGEKSDSVTVIQAGSVEVMELRSLKTASELALQNEHLRGATTAGVTDSGAILEGSRLKALFDGGGVSARVALARAGAPPEQSLLAVTDLRPVGAKGNEMVLAVLRSKRKK